MDDPGAGPRRGGEPALNDPEALAHALRAAFPHAEPFEVPWEELAAAVAAAGADPVDDALVVEALVVWESLL